MLHYSFPHRAAHLDFHNMPEATGIGRDFDADAFAATLKDSGVQAVTFFAKDCNGNAYYPTATGVPHPHLDCDVTGGVIRGSKRAGLTVTVYFNAGYDNTAGVRHREWCKLDADGRVQPQGNYYDTKRSDYFLRAMCPNSNYRDYLFSMIREIITSHPDIDGIFLDCYTFFGCHGHECIEAMRTAGVDIFDPAAVRQFAIDSTHRMAREIEELALSLKPTLNVYHNGIAYRRQLNHVEIEVLPNGGWGYDYLPAALHYARTLGKPVQTMTGRFQNTWGDVNGVRTEAGIEHDFLYSLAHGGWCSIGDHMPRHGQLHPEVYRRCRRIYERVARLEPELEGQRPLPEILVLSPPMRDFPEPMPTPQGDGWRMTPSIFGAVRVLSELKLQFDVGDDLIDLAPYRVVILPDDVRLDGPLADKLARYLEQGGKILSSGESGLAPDSDRFALAAYRNIECAGPETAFYNFIGPAKDSWPFTNYQRGGIRLRNAGDAVGFGHFYQPEFNRDSWSGEQLNYYVAPEDAPVAPAALGNDAVIHIGIPAFSSYGTDAAEPMRAWLGSLLRHWLPQPRLETRNLPSFAVASVMRREHDYRIHLLNYVPQRRGKAEIIDEPIDANDVELTLRLEKSEKIREVLSVESGELLSFRQEGNTLKITLPRLHGYALIGAQLTE